MTMRVETKLPDLDFTHGDEYAHIYNLTACQSIAICGHRGQRHGCMRQSSKESYPTSCGCGLPVCPTCLHIQRTEFAA